MIVLEGIDQWKGFSANKSFALTIGNFDGVHLGHRALLEELLSECSTKDYQLGVMTFVPHPQKILNPAQNHFLINTYEQRRGLLKEIGIEILVELHFNRDFSTLSGEQFLSHYVFLHHELKALFLGHDFAFGANKEGSFEMAKSFGDQHSVDVQLQSVFQKDQTRVSSSLIREKLSCGDMQSVNKFLGRTFFYEGLIVKGEGRGKKIGFPTANLHPHIDLLIPQKGVYITRSHLHDRVYHSVTNVGINPTFNDGNDDINVETHIFDFDDDIYGEQLRVEFLKKIRNEQKFASVNELTAQISKDVLTAKQFFN